MLPRPCSASGGGCSERRRWSETSAHSHGSLTSPCANKPHGHPFPLFLTLDCFQFGGLSPWCPCQPQLLALWWAWPLGAHCWVLDLEGRTRIT